MLTLVAILVGGVAELLPTLLIKDAVPHTGVAQKPYTPLELQGRDIYVREGCYVCHSQMVRPWSLTRLGSGRPPGPRNLSTTGLFSGAASGRDLTFIDLGDGTQTFGTTRIC